MLQKSTVATLATVLVACMLVATPVAAQENQTINFEHENAPNFYIAHDKTKAVHDMQWSSWTVYEDDQGDLADLDVSLNDSEDIDNPFSFTVTDINESDFHRSPVDKENVSLLEASEWTTTGATVSDVETAAGVEALRIEASAGDTAEMSNFSVTSDENKRVLGIALDVNSLGSGATMDISVVDEDGDAKTVMVADGASESDQLIANGTGEGYLLQHRLGDLPTEANGDGTFSNIQRVEVAVSGGAADVEIAALNVEKKSEWVLGSEKYQADDDDELETRDITEVDTAGDISITSLDTMGATFDDAQLHDLTFPAEKRLSDLDMANLMVEQKQTGNQYPGYYGTTTVYARLGLVDAYDISNANAVLKANQTFPSNYLVGVQVKEGVSDDTAFADIDGWTDETATFTTQDETYVVDQTIQSGQDHVLKITIKHPTKEMFNAYVTMGGGGGGFFGGGGFIGGFFEWFMGGLAAVLGLLGIGAARSSSGGA